MRQRHALRLLVAGALLAVAPAILGARGGCGAVNSRSEAPSIEGDWAITYDDTFDIQINIGGAVYNETLAATGGSITINHEGSDLTFNIDCSRPEVVCPSEVWPATVSADMRNPEFPHRMWVQIPQQVCSGTMITPAPADCGAGTLNPDCEEVCDGEITTSQRDTFGVINEAGDSFELYLGAGFATNGINCVLLAGSLARADLITSGSAEQGDWVVDEMTNGEVISGFGGACLWAGDPDDDGTLEALVLGASVTITTGFTGTPL